VTPNDNAPGPLPEMRLELVPVPVSDVERAKAFYAQAGFSPLVDVQPIEGMRVVQCTLPGSACSIVFGTGMREIADMQPGSVKGLHLVVADMEVARGPGATGDRCRGDHRYGRGEVRRLQRPRR
jgi:hypothetical protein